MQTKDTSVPQHNRATIIYITIDDGPSEASLSLSKLAMADSVPLTMFVIGDSVFVNNSGQALFKTYQMNPFMELANHSFTHANKHYHAYYQDPPGVVSDFELNASSLNLPAKQGRLPGRNTWRINGKKKSDLADDSTAANLLASKGYRIFGWDLEWQCPETGKQTILPAAALLKQIDQMVLRGETFTPRHVVVLSHESMFSNSAGRDELEKLLIALKRNKNYRLAFLSSYP